MTKKTKLGAIVFLSLAFALPTQASGWLDSWFGTSSVETNGEPAMGTMGAGGGGGNPPGPDDKN